MSAKRGDGRGLGADHHTVKADTSTVRRMLSNATPLAGELQADQPPRYTELAELDRGGMGAIIKARDVTGRLVAVKVLQPEVTSPDTIDRFLAEGQVTAGLEHPNIVPVHDVGTADGMPYFTMKLVRGRTLGQVLEAKRAAEQAHDESRAGRWSLQRLLRAFSRACDAIAFAHSRDVIHRDLKPDNVMVGEFGEVLVMDWGIAKKRGAPDSTSRRVVPDIEAMKAASQRRHERQDPGDSGGGLTQDGVVLGTPAYMPPEQANGEIDRIDERSDVYSLGAILYQILTLEVPFEDTTIFGTLCRVTDGDLVPPSQRTERPVPRELEAVCLKAMHRAQGRRYQTVLALQADIEAYLDGRTLSAVRYTMAQRLRKFAGRHRAAVGVALIFAVLLSGLTVGREVQRRMAFRDAVDTQMTNSESLLASWRAPGVTFTDAQAQSALAMLHAFDELLEVQPTHAALRTRRRDLTRAFGDLALSAREFALASYAYRELARIGVSHDEIQRLIGTVQAARTEVTRTRRQRLREIAAEMLGGVLAGWQIEDRVHETASFADVPTVQELGAIIGRQSKLRGDRDWTRTELQLMRWCARSLGRIRLPESVEPLACLADHGGTDATLLVEIGQALCNTGDVGAWEPLITLARRVGIRSATWRRISPLARKLPAPGPMAMGDQRTVADRLQLRGRIRKLSGDLEGALEDLDRAIELDAGHAQAYAARGMVHLRNDNIDAATTDLDRAIELAPDAGPFYINRGILYERQRDPSRARQCYTVAIEKDPTNSTAWHNRGHLLLRLGKPEAALADLRKAVSLDPKNFENQLTISKVLEQLRDYRSALAALDEATRLVPDDPKVFCRRAGLRERLRDLPGALADLDRALTLDPRHTGAHLQRGIVRRKSGDLDGAIADFTEAIRLGPNDGTAYSNRGNVWRDKKELRRALRDHDTACHLGPKDHRFANNLGVTLLELKRYAQAEEAFARCVDLNPRNANAWINLAIALAHQGRKGDARNALADARRHGATSRKHKARIAQVERVFKLK